MVIYATYKREYWRNIWLEKSYFNLRLNNTFQDASVIVAKSKVTENMIALLSVNSARKWYSRFYHNWQFSQSIEEERFTSSKSERAGLIDPNLDLLKFIIMISRSQTCFRKALHLVFHGTFYGDRRRFMYSAEVHSSSHITENERSVNR